MEYELTDNFETVKNIGLLFADNRIYDHKQEYPVLQVGDESTPHMLII